MLKAQESSYFRRKGKFWEPCKKSDKNRIEMNFSDIKSEELCPQPINFKQISELFEKSVRIDDSMELGKTIKFMNDNNKEFISGINQDPAEAKTSSMKFWKKFEFRLGIGDSFGRNNIKSDKEEDVDENYDSEMHVKSDKSKKISRQSNKSLASVKNSKYEDNAKCGRSEMNMKKSEKNGHVKSKSSKKVHVINKNGKTCTTKTDGLKVSKETVTDSSSSQEDDKTERKTRKLRKNSARRISRT